MNVPLQTGSKADSSFEELVACELAIARSKHRRPISGRHEGLAVIREEYVEFENEVFQQEPLPEAMLEELVQIAAMCRRVAEDLELQ